MGDTRSGANEISKCLMAVIIAASMVGSGCAGVVMGTPSGNSGTPAPGTPSPTSTAQPQLSAIPMSASFPAVATGSTSSQTITLQNGGTASVTISSVSVTGTGFGTSGLALPISITPGQSTTFNVVFTPSSAGSGMGSIALVSNAPNSPLIISTSGSSITSTALLSSSTSSLDFGSVLLGSSSSLGATLTNTGNTNVTISNLLVNGAGFAVSGAGANTTLTPGQTAVLNVTFAPSATGSVAGSIVIGSNAGALSIALAGSGAQPSPHSVALSWDPSTSVVVGYNVYRVLADGTYAKINSAPIVVTDYTDAKVQSGQTYTYAVTAVDASNIESDYSDPVLATIP